MLLESGANINKIKTSGTLIGSTALIKASKEGHIDTVKALLDAGSEVNKKIIYGGRDFTALGFAKMEGFPEIVNLLKKYGAKE